MIYGRWNKKSTIVERFFCLNESFFSLMISFVLFQRKKWLRVLKGIRCQLYIAICTDDLLVIDETAVIYTRYYLYSNVFKTISPFTTSFVYGKRTYPVCINIWRPLYTRFFILIVIRQIRRVRTISVKNSSLTNFKTIIQYSNVIIYVVFS